MDVVAPSSAIIDIWKGVMDGALNFSIESDEQIVFDSSQGFRLRLDLVELGGGTVEHFHATETFGEGSVASISDLLLLRALTVVNRGSDGDCWGFKWLLSAVAKTGHFPEIDEEELEVLDKAARKTLGGLGRLVVAALLGSNNTDKS
jgi:hypothetical protein